jgi:DNA-binding NarL/FixJ family response regulator
MNKLQTERVEKDALRPQFEAEIDELRKRIRHLESLWQEDRAYRDENDLSEAEREVLVLIAQGYSNKQIAAKRNTIEMTTRAHVSSILRKLQVENRTEAALHAWRNDIVSIEEAWEVVKNMQWKKVTP